jgi:hypothetical protein
MKAREISVSLAFPMRGEDGPSTFDLCFSVQADLQHLEFSGERAKPSQHVGGPLPTQRFWTFGDQ